MPRLPPPAAGGRARPPSAAAQAEEALQALRRSGMRTDQAVYASLIDLLAKDGQTLAAHAVWVRLVADHNVVPHPRLCHFVFEGLMWAKHLDPAAEMVVFLRRVGAAGWAEKAWRLARVMREDGFSAPAARLLDDLGLLRGPRRS